MYKNNISGIYRIINVLDNKSYIGSSVNIYSRWKVHEHLLNNNKHGSIKLQRAWNKYGPKVFKFEIIETCEPIRDTLIFLEQKYLDLKPEYNTCYFSSCTLGFKHNDKTKKILSEKRKGKYTKEKNFNWKGGVSFKDPCREKFRWQKDHKKSVLMLDKKTGEVLKAFSSIRDAGKYCGGIEKKSAIAKVLQGKRPSVYGYKWILKVVNDDI